MPHQQQASSSRRATAPFTIILSVFALGLLHRAAQLWLVADVVKQQVALNPNWLSMQHLPTSMLEKQFFAAMLYLQQTPPLPNLLIGILSHLTSSPIYKPLALIAFGGILSSIAGALLAALLLRMRVWQPLAFAVALVFIASSGVLLLEYTAFGQCFYEQLTMVGCLVAALAATSLVQNHSWKAAAWLGLAVAMLALSRATYSYFVFPVIAWLVWQRVPARYLLVFLIPVALLHGGWAAKQYWVQGQWLWATSTWGGANAQAGEFKRRGVFQMRTSTKVDCFKRWPIAPYGIFFSFKTFYPDPDLARNMELLSPDLGPSPEARAADLAANAARGEWLSTDTAGFRELSACVQRMYMRHWWRHPGDAYQGWRRSYEQFWQPLDSYTEIMPVMLIASRPPLPAEPSLLQRLQHFFDEPDYFARQETLPQFIGSATPRLVPANIAVIPFAPQLATLLAFAMLHGLPFAAAYIRLKKGSLQDAYPAGFSFLLMSYLYMAAICNLVEYGENMRFRLPVEPIAWAIGIVAAGALWTALRSTTRPASVQRT